MREGKGLQLGRSLVTAYPDLRVSNIDQKTKIMKTCSGKAEMCLGVATLEVPDSGPLESEQMA